MGHTCCSDPAVAVAVVEAGSCSSGFTPGLGTSTCQGCGPKKTKKKKERKKKNFYLFIYLFIFCLFLPFLEPLPWHMEVPRLGVKSEL